MYPVPERKNPFKLLLTSQAKVRALMEFDNEYGFHTLMGEEAEEYKERLKTSLSPISDEIFSDVFKELEFFFLKCKIFNFLDTQQQMAMSSEDGKKHTHLKSVHIATRVAYDDLKAAFKEPENYTARDLEKRKQALREAYEYEVEVTPIHPEVSKYFQLPDLATASEILIRSAEVMGIYDKAIRPFNARTHL